MTTWDFRPLKRTPAGAETEVMTGVVVADDHPLFRSGVARAIDAWPTLELLGQADDGARALDLIMAVRPDVALVDLRMPGLTGTELCRALRDREAGVQVVVLSAAEDPAVVREALESGAAGFLSKESTDEEICSAIERAAAGETIVSPNLHGMLFAEIAGRRAGPTVRLSNNERRALELASQGHSNAEIGAEMFISAATVKSYLTRAFEKLSVSDRAHAVSEALRRGLIQ